MKSIEIFRTYLSDVVRNGKFEIENDCSYAVVRKKYLGRDNRASYYELIFMDKCSGKYYKVNYEYNSGFVEELRFTGFDEDSGCVKCTEVKPVEVTIIEYQPV